MDCRKQEALGCVFLSGFLHICSNSADDPQVLEQLKVVSKPIMQSLLIALPEASQTCGHCRKHEALAKVFQSGFLQLKCTRSVGSNADNDPAEQIKIVSKPIMRSWMIQNLWLLLRSMKVAMNQNQVAAAGGQ